MVLFTYFLFGETDALLYRPGQIWPKEVGLLASGILTINDTIDSTKAKRLAQNVAQAFTVSSVATVDGKNQPASSKEIATIFSNPRLNDAQKMDDKTKDEIKVLKINERGFSDWKSTADTFISGWSSKHEDWRRAVSAAATKVENNKFWVDEGRWYTVQGGHARELTLKSEFDKGKDLSEWLKEGKFNRAYYCTF